MSDSQIPNDAELVRRFRSGDMRAYALLLERYQVQVFGFVNRMVRGAPEAEDLAQETFVRMYERMDGLADPGRFRSWLWSIAANLCRDHFPDGRFDGDWFHAEGWQGNPFLTVHVNLQTGRWHVTERRWVSPAPGAIQ